MTTPTTRAAGGGAHALRPRPWLLCRAVGVLAGLGLQTQLYSAQERPVSTALMYVGLAAAWNLVGGFTGYACFGQVGFFGWAATPRPC